MVYGAALLHEIAHAVVACSYGLKIEEIELLPFGGVARIKDLDLSTWDPKTEVAVALAGPVENLVLAGAAWILAGYGVWNVSLAGLFLQANLAVAAFNPVSYTHLSVASLILECWTPGRQRAARLSAVAGNVAAANVALPLTNG